MGNKILKFSEGWFTKKGEVDSSEPIKGGFKTTVPRPELGVNRLSDEDRKKQIDSFQSSKSESKVDVYFIQEISDRLYGPDSAEYIQAIKELNTKFRARTGKHGNQLYDDEFAKSYKDKEKDIINSIKSV